MNCLSKLLCSAAHVLLFFFFFFFFFKEKFEFCHTSASRLQNIVRGALKKKEDISGFIWHKLFIQTVKYSFFHQWIVSMVWCSCLVFFFLQGKVLCFGTCWQVAFLDHVYFMSKKIIFQMHFLLEGIVEASLPGSNWQKTVNFLFNGKILSPSNKYSVSQFSVKVPMKWKIIAAYFTGFSKK